MTITILLNFVMYSYNKWNAYTLGKKFSHILITCTAQLINHVKIKKSKRADINIKANINNQIKATH